MLTYIVGNLLEANSQALVNTVNTVGVMGKGIALQFKEAYPSNYKIYVNACKLGKFNIGELLITSELTLDKEKIIINFPTKKDWKQRSSYLYIEKGLEALRRELEKGVITSIAIPPLGCGNGGLDWQKVKSLMEQYLGDLETQIFIYEPTDSIKAHLAQQITVKNAATLTDKRAMLLYAMYQYEVSMNESVNLFVINKLAYFLQRLGEPLKLSFKKSHFGPYTQQIQHVMYALNGTFLYGLEQNEARAFENLKLNYDKVAEVKEVLNKQLSTEQKQRLNNLLKLIRGFESFLALETLATVDFILKDNPSYTLEKLMLEIQNWSDRKAKQITESLVKIAMARLSEYKDTALLTFA